MRALRYAIAVSALTAVPAAAQPTYETVYSFSHDPGRPSSLVVGSDENLHGVTTDGGDFSGGTIFAIERHPDGTHTYHTLHHFTSIEGWHPRAVVRGRGC